MNIRILHISLLFHLAIALVISIEFQLDEEVPVRTEIDGVSNYLKDVKRKACQITLAEPEKCGHSFKLFDPSERFSRLLTLERDSGRLMTNSRIDYEELCPGRLECLFEVSILSVSKMQLLSERLTVIIRLNDVNDNTPEWDKKSFDKMLTTAKPYNGHETILNIYIDEHSEHELDYSLKSVQLPIAIDKDSGPNGKIDYRLEALLFPQTNDTNSNGREFSLFLSKVDSKLWLIPNVRLDAETRDFYEFILIAEDSGLLPRSSKLHLKVYINDINDEVPVFTKQTYYPDEFGGYIHEKTPIGTSIIRLSASDNDKTSPNRDVTYELVQTGSTVPHQDIFGVQETGHVVILKDIDFERLIHYDREDEEGMKVFSLLVRAKDAGIVPGSKSSTATIIIPIKDENDTPPKVNFNYVIDTGEMGSGSVNKHKIIGQIREHSQVPLQVAYVHVTDPDLAGRDQIHCLLTNRNEFNLTVIPKNTGDNTEKKEVDYMLILNRPLDREKETSVHLTIECADSALNKAVEHLTIEVTDINDHQPIFRQDEYIFDVVENQEPSNGIPERFNGYLIGRLEAFDKDLGDNAKVQFSLVDNLKYLPVNYSHMDRLIPSLNVGQGLQAYTNFAHVDQVFSISPDTGALYAKTPLDAETFHEFTFEVEASDRPKDKSLVKNSRVNVTVRVIDTNDKEPIFIMKQTTDQISTGNSYIFSVFENETIGSNVGSITAMDLDRTSLVRGEQDHRGIGFRMSQDSPPLSRSTFKVNSLNGMITLSKRLDREAQPMFSFEVLAIDQKIGRSGLTLTSTATVTLLIEDVNDNDPEFVKPIQLWQLNEEEADSVNINHLERNLQLSVNQIPTIIIGKSQWMIDETNPGNEGCKLFTVKGRDADFGLNAELTYTMESGNSDDRYYLDRHTGEVHLINYRALIESATSPTLLDGTNSIYNLVEFKVCDKGEPMRCSQKMLVQILYELHDGDLGVNNKLDYAKLISRRKDSLNKKDKDATTSSFFINEAVVICMAIIFSILVLVTVILVFLIRNRSSLLSRSLLKGKRQTHNDGQNMPGTMNILNHLSQKDLIFYKPAHMIQDGEFFHMATVPNEAYEVTSACQGQYSSQTFARTLNQRLLTPKMNQSKTTTTLQRHKYPGQLLVIDNAGNSLNDSSTYQKLNHANLQPKVDHQKFLYSKNQTMNSSDNYMIGTETNNDYTDDETRDELEKALSNNCNGINKSIRNHFSINDASSYLSRKCVSDAYKEASFV